jgi:xanthine dehydrogenase iron-sulfur cluster and FAD-binding subunit A
MANAKRNRHPPLVMSCPWCRCKLSLRYAAPGCYSGECGRCCIEIEAVTNDGRITCEIYPIRTAGNEDESD